MNSHDCLPAGLIAQLVWQCTNIVSLNFFSGFSFTSGLVVYIIDMITDVFKQITNLLSYLDCSMFVFLPVMAVQYSLFQSYLWCSQQLCPAGTAV